MRLAFKSVLDIGFIRAHSCGNCVDRAANGPAPGAINAKREELQMLARMLPPARESAEINTRPDTRDYLAHATKQARPYDDYEVIVDIDARVSESRFWGEI